jgi:hypothetical protein
MWQRFSGFPESADDPMISRDASLMTQQSQHPRRFQDIITISHGKSF